MYENVSPVPVDCTTKPANPIMSWMPTVRGFLPGSLCFGRKQLSLKSFTVRTLARPSGQSGRFSWIVSVVSACYDNVMLKRGDLK